MIDNATPSSRVASSIPKRAFDIIVSLLALLLFSPVLLIVALLVRFRIGAPVLFKQTRPGLNGEPFEIIKFRTMTNEVDEYGQLLPDDARLPPFGRFLRSTSLDELPELINVLRGEMSLVGPRPLIMRYLPRYTPEQARRNLARPGITGLAQVHGRNALAWEERFALDVEYVAKWNFFLDLKILVWTVRAVVKREGISAEGHATVPEFMGSEDRPPSVSKHSDTEPHR